MLALDIIQSFLVIVFFTAVGFSIDLKRGKTKGHTTPARVVTLVALTLFCFGLSAIFCQIVGSFGLSVPLFVGAAAFAVLVRNCSEIADEDFPDIEAGVMGCVSLCGVLAVAVMA